MTSSAADPPGDIPDVVLEYLEESTDSQLRTLIHYAQRLLRERPSLTDEIEARAGERLVRKDDHGAYTFVVMKRPEESGEEGGPYAYHVRWEPGVEGADGKYRWHYLGRVYGEAGGEIGD